MKTDIAKVSFDELKHFVGVFHQMGRLSLESDANEQNELMLRMVQRVAGDAMHTGSPNHGFRVDTHVLLDAMESRRGWTATPANTALFVDYFNHRVGDGSLVSVGATALARRLDAPLDLSRARELLIALRADAGAPCVFYVSDGSVTHAYTMADVHEQDGWRVVRATPGAWTAGLAPEAIVEYGFTTLAPATRYAFDFIKADLPLHTVLVRPERADTYAAVPATATLAADDDRRLWGSPSLHVSGATQLAATLPAPHDLSRARELRVAVQSTPAAAALTLTLVDDATPPATLALSGATVETHGAWRVLRFTLPQAGSFNWAGVTAVRYGGLSADASYTFGAVLLEADPARDLVVMGGDGTSAGAGRFYGEGLAATRESHGTYFTQADLPQADPAALAPVAEGRRRIDWAYLDLWERPITYVEHSALRDVALDGDDTCTRTQLVAQVRLLKGVEVPFADTAPPPADVFARLPRWGHGVLSTKDKPAATLDPCADPCEPLIDGPYLGEENRLFRVEIHRAGQIGTPADAGTALYKWSRHNGALTTALIADAQAGDHSVQVEKPELYAVGDLIELADDLVDLITGPCEDRVNHSRHTRGELRRIVTVNLQTRRVGWQDASVADPAQVPFHAPLPRALRPAHHAKITQWDGVGAVVAGDIVLADGIVIEFGGSQLAAGDYWQFATRTADRSVERLIEAPPRGTRHAFYPLAALHRSRESAAGAEVVFAEDLRPRFAALPRLDASRIAYDPGAGAVESPIAGWGEVSTVQEAIDALCRADLSGDMKLHNRLLHGMGVICGLKLRCAKDRQHLILGKGYALECDGTLLHQSGDDTVPIVKMAEAQGLLDSGGSGAVNLWVEQTASGVAVHIEEHRAQSFWDSVLEGSLLKDFWEKGIKTLIDFVKAQFTPPLATTVPLPDSHKRVISLLNLIWQKINPATGPYLFVSPKEHELLEKLHAELQELLASKAYCALFDTLTVFPAYPYHTPTGLDTMFGAWLLHRQLKHVPHSDYIVSYGIGNKVQVFDPGVGEAVLIASFPGASNVIVRDVAFDPRGTEMTVVATTTHAGHTDSVFATATLHPPASAGAAPTITWGPSTVVCDIEFTTLATHDNQTNRLFAIGRSPNAARQGLYRFTLPTIPLAPAPVVTFNATGLFAIDTDGVNAVATAHPNPAVLDGSFTGLRRINLNTLATSTPAAFSAMGATMGNDLVIANGLVYLTGNNIAGPALFRFRLNPESALGATALGASSVWRLCLVPSRNALLVVDTDQCRARVFNTSTNTMAPNLRIPLQIFPVSMVARPDQRLVYALNMVSNTVSAINLGMLLSSPPTFMAEPPTSLAAYRQQMLQAYTDLAGVLLQYLKDTWTDLFLVECPTCGKEDRVYLGTIHIEKARVFKICNFSKRHYAKSFRTWSYWLSAVPALSVAKKLFARFACSTLVP